MKLVPDYKQCHKWVSMHCMVLAGAVQGAWVYIPEDMRQSIPSKLITIITIGLLILGVVGRLIKQGKNDVNTH